jgi:hypothetical protein
MIVTLTWEFLSNIWGDRPAARGAASAFLPPCLLPASSLSRSPSRILESFG